MAGVGQVGAKAAAKIYKEIGSASSPGFVIMGLKYGVKLARGHQNEMTV